MRLVAIRKLMEVAGRSLVVVLPKKEAYELGYKKGDKVALLVDENNNFVIAKLEVIDNEKG